MEKGKKNDLLTPSFPIYSTVGLFDSPKFPHLKIQSSTLHGITKLVTCHETSLIFGVITEERGNIACYRLGKRKYQKI